MENNFTNQVQLLLKDYFSPLLTSFESEESALNFFKHQLGWDIDELFVDAQEKDKLIAIIGSIQGYLQHVGTSNSEDSIPEFVKRFGESDFAKIFDDISAIKDIRITIPEIDIKELIPDLLNWLTINYLANYQIKIYNILNLLTIIDATHENGINNGIDGNILRFKNYLPEIRFDKLTILLKRKNVSDLFKFHTVEEINAVTGTIMEPLAFLVNSFGVFCVYGAGNIPTEMNNIGQDRHKSLLYLEKYWLTGNAVAKVALTMGFLLDNVVEGGPGIYVNPEGLMAIHYSKSGWIITVDTGLQLPFKINKQGLTPFDSSVIKPEITIRGYYSPLAGTGNKAFQFGKSSEPNISVQTLKASVFGDFNEDVVSYGISAEITDCIVTLKIDNSFIKAIIPDDAHVKFNFEIGYSSKNGFHFGGSGGLDLKLAQNITIGAVQLRDTRLSLKPTAAQAVNSGLEFNIGTNILARLGPLGVTIEELGLTANVEFPPDGTGNLGLINFHPGIKPPTSIGLSLKTDAIEAVGFLKIDTEKGEYVGAVAIDIKAIKLRVAAIGIITTRPPAGVTDPTYFSLLIIITAEFPPITLGFGFFLIGLGGLLGVKRTMLKDELRAAIKGNTLEGILFPKVDVKNVGPVVSGMQRIFQATAEERFLIGPMMKLSWGTPTIITAEIGVIIELPAPVSVAILGIVRISLPEPAKEIIHLQINFLGIIDFEKKLISLDAALEDSRVLTITLTGQFALRVGWGSNPLFIFSAGGFHPDFKEAPVELQGMERLGIQVIDEEALKLCIDCYFAITTNTVQFGAHAHFWAKLLEYTAEADVSFDALILFNPFAFTLNLQVNGRVKGPLVDAVIDVRANLTGPNRWHVWGQAYAKLLIEIRIPFDTSFGEALEELMPETIRLMELYKKEIQKDMNWKAVTPLYTTSGITIRNLSATEIGDSIIVHPNTTLSFSQRLVPLEINIERFGNKLLADAGKSFPVSVSGPTFSTGIPLYDLFTPGNFFNIPTERKLSTPSFESMQSGREFTITTSSPQASISKYKEIDFEVIYLNNLEKNPTRSVTPLGDAAMIQLAGGGAAAKSQVSFENNRSSCQAPAAVIFNKPLYYIKRKSDLETVTKWDSAKNKEIEAEPFVSQAEAYAAQTLYGLEETVIISTFEL